MNNPIHETFTYYESHSPQEYDRDFNHTKAKQRVVSMLSVMPEPAPEQKFAKTKKDITIEVLTSDFSDTMTRELLSNFLHMDLLRDFLELQSIGKALIKSAGEKSRDELANEIVIYFQRVNIILEEVELDKNTTQRVHDLSADCVKKVLSIIGGNTDIEVLSQNSSAYKDLLQGITWQEHFKNNPPPKYEGVKKSGKALQFFLEQYRGESAADKNHKDAQIDYVVLGLTQADLRHYDSRLLRALINADQYKKGISLNSILPPAFTKNHASLHV